MRPPPYPPTSMSAVSSSRSNFVSIFNAALETYERKTKKDLASHPLLPSFQSCDSPEAILTALREQIPAFGQSQNGDDGLTKWVTPTVNVLYAFSATLGQGVGLVNIKVISREVTDLMLTLQAFPPANAIFAGIGVLLSVSVLYCSLVRRLRPILTPTAPRRQTIPALVQTILLASLTGLNVFSADSRFTLAFHRLPLWRI